MSFSAYLVGTWERRFNIGTTIQIVNPTNEYLDVNVAFFDDNEECLKCIKSEKPLSPNDLWEIPVDKFKEKEFGVVKIISLDPESRAIMPGIVGFKRHFIAAKEPEGIEVAFSESPLAAIPGEKYAEAEYELIREHCKCE